MDSVIDKINKIKSTVSGALPGNPVSREYELDKQVASAGPGLAWKLFSARKRSTKQDVTVWILEKKQFDVANKGQKEFILDSMRRGISNLTRLRHPKILSVVHPLEESRESFAFATEPLLASLANLIGATSNLSDAIICSISNYEFSEVEIKYGMLQLCEALGFLHNDCHQAHLNLTPASIVLNRVGTWKLCGFEFSEQLSSSDESSSARIPIWTQDGPLLTQPSLNFCAPELAIRGLALASSDIFSLGCLFYSVYNKGDLLLDVSSRLHDYKLMISKLDSLPISRLGKIPDDLKEYVKLMLNSEPRFRPDALQFLQTAYFGDASISSLKSLDNIYQLDNLAKSQFYKSLPKAIPILPKRVSLHRIFPQLSEEFATPTMIPFLLPTILQVMEVVSKEEFMEFMLPSLLPVFNLREPIQIILILLQNLHIIVSKFPPVEFRTSFLPVLNSALDSGNRVIQELCLNHLANISTLLDYTVLKSSIWPRMKKLFRSTDVNSVRMACLTCLGKLMENMDKWFVIDEVLPFIAEIRNREPAILVCIYALYRIAFSHKKLGVGLDVLASRVLPVIIPLSIDNNLNPLQYSLFAELIRDMTNRLQSEHMAKLEQLHGMTHESATIEIAGADNVCSSKDYVEFIVSKFVHAESPLGSQSANIGSCKGDDQLPISVQVTSSLDNSPGSDNRPIELASPSHNLNGPSMQSTSMLSLEDKRRLASSQQTQLCFNNSRTDHIPLVPSALTKPRQQIAKKTTNMITSTSTGQPIDLFLSNLAAFSSTSSNSSGTFSSSTSSFCATGSIAQSARLDQIQPVSWGGVSAPFVIGQPISNDKSLSRQPFAATNFSPTVISTPWIQSQLSTLNSFQANSSSDPSKLGQTSGSLFSSSVNQPNRGIIGNPHVPASTSLLPIRPTPALRLQTASKTAIISGTDIDALLS